MLISSKTKARLMLALISSASLAFMFQSCDGTYDLENIGGNVHIFENGLDVPIGSTKKFYLGDFITEDATLVVQDGRYVLQYNGDAGTKAIEVPTMHFDEVDPNLSTTHLDFYKSLYEIPEIAALMDAAGYTGGPLPTIPGLEAPDAHAEIPGTTEVFSISINDVPEQVVNVQELTFKDGTIVTLSLHTEGIPETVTHLTFDFKLIPPKQMKLVPVEDDIILETGGVYHITHDLPVVNGMLDDVVHFNIDGLLFDPALQPNSNHVIDIESSLYYEGSIHINEPFDLSGWTPVLDFKVGFVMSESEIESVKARAQVTVDPVEVSTELDGLPDILSDGTAILDLQSVMFELDVDNSTPISIETDMEMQSTFYDGTQSPLIELSQPLHVDANTSETIVLTNDAQYAGTMGYIPNLNELVSRVPKSIYMKATPYMPESDVELILGSVYNFGAKYRMSVPLVFGDELNLSLDTDVTGLDSEGEYLSYAHTAVIAAEIVNTLPLDFAINAFAIDHEGNVMDNVTIENLPLVVAGDSNSRIEIILVAEGDKATLSELAGVRLNFSVTSKTGGELRPDQYLQLNDISLSLSEGANVDEEEIFN